MPNINLSRNTIRGSFKTYVTRKVAFLNRPPPFPLCHTCHFFLQPLHSRIASFTKTWQTMTWQRKRFFSINAWKMSKCGVFSGPYFAAFELNTGKYGPERNPYLDTFHAVYIWLLNQITYQRMQKSDNIKGFKKTRNCSFNPCVLSFLHIDTQVLTSHVNKIVEL